MANRPPSMYIKPQPLAGFQLNRGRRDVTCEQLIVQLCNPDLREDALARLSERRDSFQQDFALSLWHSFGAIAALLQEIISIYPALAPGENLTAEHSNRVCKAVALLRSVAAHPETRMFFLTAHLPLYLYPFLHATGTSKPYEFLRLTSLGVIGALVKVEDTEVVSFLLSTEIIPLCLRAMEIGAELSKTVATYIVRKILSDDLGLDYMCATVERFHAVTRVLGNMTLSIGNMTQGIITQSIGNMTQSIIEPPSLQLLKHIILCYLRLSDNAKALDALRVCLPVVLADPTLNKLLHAEDLTTWQWLRELLHRMSGNHVAAQAHQPGPGYDYRRMN